MPLQEAFVPQQPWRIVSWRPAKTSELRPKCSLAKRCRVQCSTDPPVSRRSMMRTLTFAFLASAVPAKAEEYDAMTSERYLDYGRPKSENQLPMFESSRKSFDIGQQLLGQDVKIGKGESIEKGSLVKAKWVISLDDGTIVEDNTKSGSVIFRVGAGQVARGIEGAVTGMKKGGSRIVQGPSDSFFSDITSGERTLVPKESTVMLNVLIEELDPYARK